MPKLINILFKANITFILIMTFFNFIIITHFNIWYLKNFHILISNNYHFKLIQVNEDILYSFIFLTLYLDSFILSISIFIFFLHKANLLLSNHIKINITNMAFKVNFLYSSQNIRHIYMDFTSQNHRNNYINSHLPNSLFIYNFNFYQIIRLNLTLFVSYYFNLKNIFRYMIYLNKEIIN